MQLRMLLSAICFLAFAAWAWIPPWSLEYSARLTVGFLACVVAFVSVWGFARPPVQRAALAAAGWTLVVGALWTAAEWAPNAERASWCGERGHYCENFAVAFIPYAVVLVSLVMAGLVRALQALLKSRKKAV